MSYSTMKDHNEEAKCLELAIRKYKNHSLSTIIEEHIIARVHQASVEDRYNTYRILLIALRFVSNFLTNNDNTKLIKSITSTWNDDLFLKKDKKDEIALQIAYRLENKVAILELCNQFIKDKNINLLQQSIFCFLTLRQDIYIKKLLEKVMNLLSQNEINLIKIAILSHKNLYKAFNLFKSLKITNKNEVKLFAYLLQLAIDKRFIAEISFESLQQFDFLTSLEQMYLDSIYLQIFLLRKDLKKATNLIEKYPINILSDEKLYFHYLYGCWLFLTKSKNQATIYFQNVYQELYPSIYTLLSHYLIKNIAIKKQNLWYKTSFYLEKQHLFRQLAFFYNCTAEKSKEDLFLKKLGKNI